MGGTALLSDNKQFLLSTTQTAK